MSVNRKNTSTSWVDPDEIPDMTAPEWEAKIIAAAVKRGRPQSANPKRLTSLRLDADVVESFRATGPGWQSRINAVLREWVERH